MSAPNRGKFWEVLLALASDFVEAVSRPDTCRAYLKQSLILRQLNMVFRRIGWMPWPTRLRAQ